MNDFSEKPSAWKGPFEKANLRLSTSTRQTDLLLPGTPAPVELEVPITELPISGALFGDEMSPIVQNGITCRTTVGYISKSGQAPVYINKTIQLVYPATIGQTIFSLNTPDHYGNQWALTDANALQVTVGGIRLVQDDGTGIGQYTVNLFANSVTLLTPFGTDPVVIVGDGDVVVFDIYGLTKTTITTNVNQSQIITQSLAIATANVLPPLALAPNGAMTIVYVNGRAFSDKSVPPSFSVSGNTITWSDPVYSVVPGDIVVVSYAYGVPQPFQFSPLPINAVNDAAAATAGVVIGGVYRNGSVLMVRVA